MLLSIAQQQKWRGQTQKEGGSNPRKVKFSIYERKTNQVNILLIVHQITCCQPLRSHFCENQRKQNPIRSSLHLQPEELDAIQVYYPWPAIQVSDMAFVHRRKLASAKNRLRHCTPGDPSFTALDMLIGFFVWTRMKKATWEGRTS